ncbi:MAG: hypothetical protein UR92_C0009G0008 [Candidatus Nomurabacteria bacterium GW2011_GWA2_35_80]|uniref:Uncharacterized protein n=1 Tax=Candidatus Nomurabacteria bacterium GW2011_GWA2_35_80 TaxID=1618733 RepID=A0A0G0DHN2_9BACT|nr:MAG: hypothetical protein UR92_C0009G0008 [Candidatus Nomurabacteria bacterium GW2011_GWA2_35_80]
MNDMLARQKARAVGKITTALLLNDPSEEDLRVINSLPDATIKRRVKTIYFPLPKNIILEPEQNYWSIVVPDMNPQKAFELRKQITSVYEYTSVSKIIDVYPRIKVSVIKANLDTKVEYPNVSLNKSMELGLFGTTFTEGCLIDGRVFKDSGVHLDVSSWTLHTGSRGSDGRVPRSRWLDVEFNVRSYNPDYASPYLSLRQKQF